MNNTRIRIRDEIKHKNFNLRQEGMSITDILNELGASVGK